MKRLNSESETLGTVFNTCFLVRASAWLGTWSCASACLPDTDTDIDTNTDTDTDTDVYTDTNTNTDTDTNTNTETDTHTR